MPSINTARDARPVDNSDILVEAAVSPTSSSGTTAAERRAERVSFASLPHKVQLCALMLTRLAEALAHSSISSYVFFQLQYFDPSKPSSAISAEVGLVVSAKTAAHVCTGLLWGRLADSQYVGRKPVLLIGLLASSCAMLGYGFSSSFPAAIAWQVADGALNSTISLVRCMVAELYQDKRYRVRALTLLPLFANAGNLLGPLIGGFLVTHHSRKTTSIGSDYPYAMPNIFIAVLYLTTFLFVLVFVKETHILEPSANKPTRSPIQYLRSLFQKRSSDRPLSSKAQLSSESSETSPLLPSTTPAPPTESNVPPKTSTSLFTRPIITTMLTLFIASAHLGTFPHLLAVFISTSSAPLSSQHPPLNIHGGIGLSPRGVGLIMALLGGGGVALQVLLYPSLNDRFGTIKLWRSGLGAFVGVYAVWPFVALVASFLGQDGQEAKIDVPKSVIAWGLLGLIVFLSIACRMCVVPATSLLINESAGGRREVRGRVHVLGTTVGSLSKAVFPVFILGAFGHGVDVGVVGLGWWIMAAFAGVAVVASMWVGEG